MSTHEAITDALMLKRVKQLKNLVNDRYDEGSHLHTELIKAIEFIPVGWRITDRVICEMAQELEAGNYETVSRA